MNLHGYKKAFDEMEPEKTYMDELWNRMEQGSKPSKAPRILRVSLIAAAVVILLCGGVFAASRVNWNDAYRDFFHIESDSVQGFVEYPPVEPEERPTLQPVSCVTGIQMLEIRFSYGPIDREQADRLMEHFDEENNEIVMPQEILCVELEGLSYSDRMFCGIQEYDEATGMALVQVSGWYDVLPEQVNIKLSLADNQQDTAMIQPKEELGTLQIQPETPEVKTAVLNLTTSGPDGQKGGILSLKVDAGSYCWVEDIPGIQDFDTLDEAIRDEVFGQYITDWDNLLLEQFLKDAYLTFADGTTKTLGAGVSCTWDGAHYCQWGGGVYDLENLVSVTIGGASYLFSTT